MDTKIDHALLICKEKLKTQVKNLKAQAKTSKLKTTIKIKTLSKNSKLEQKNSAIIFRQIYLVELAKKGPK